MLIDSSMANSTIDVSDDIQAGKVILTENGLHTMTINLLNKNRKYDHAFTPNDRFVIYMKRVTELVVMTGYLNSVPYVNAWPRSVEITGYCANKRALYHFWDPGTIASYGLLTSIGQVSGNSTAVDGGMSRIAQKILTQVAGYNPDKIHIGQLPGTWLKSITQVYDAVEAQVGNAFSSLGGGNNVGSTNPTVVIGGTPANIPAGAELPVTWGTVTKVAPPSFDIQSPNGIFWIGMQWGYKSAPNGTNTPGIDINAAKKFISEQKVVISNVETNKGVILQPAGWGPKGTTNAISLDPEVMAQLGLNEGDDVNVAYVSDGSNVNLGIYNPVTNSAALTQAQSVTANHAIGGNPTNKSPYVSGGMTGQQVGVVTGPPAAAAAFAIKICQPQTWPYVWSGGHPFTTQIPPPAGGWDCSGMVGCAWFAAGVTIGGTSQEQWAEIVAAGGRVQQSQIQPGDLIFSAGSDGTLTSPGHVAMYVGNNQVAVAPTTGEKLQVTDADFTTDFVGIGRPAYSGDTTANGSSFSFGPGNTGGSQGASNSLVTYWDWFGNGPDPLSAILYGPRALMNDQPVLPFFDMIIKASMRSWCAAPNGDMICWFPDYFGIYGTAGVVNVTAIELEDLSVYWSDQSLVTHQFVAGTSAPSVIGSSPGGPVQAYNIATTMGIATVEFPQILQTLFGLGPGESTSKLSQSIINRFGIRPNFTPMETIMGPEAEFWYAIYLFQMNWANQFSATVPITFMPELYPGMLMRATDFGFQGYVTQVTHSFNLSQGGGFKTEVEIIAPSTYGHNNKGLYSFVKGGYGGMM